MKNMSQKIQIKVSSDQIDNFNKQHSGFNSYFDVVPMDLYGKRITLSKQNNKLQDIIDDSNDFYGIC
jgi:hypothetical protein